MADRQLFTIEDVAAICHEANRRLSWNIGEHGQHRPWIATGEELRESIAKGVRLILNNPEVTPDELHEAWMADKLRNGWGYGPIKDEAKRTHPNLVPYHQLPPEQHAKDYLFRGIVESLRGFIRPEIQADTQVAGAEG